MENNQRTAILQRLSGKKDEIINYLLGIYGHPNEAATADEAMLYQQLVQEEQAILKELDA